MEENQKKINPNKIRNFSIIAHIDHGKSTLADRLLEKTNLKNSSKSLERVLDSLSLEQEKGITIKLNAVQLYYPPESPEPYIFNLIDTPGHVDFMYEVSRSLAACEGVILLVDAVKGIQAQTLAYYEIAKNLNLKILPVINKIDLPHAQLETTKNQLIELLNCQESDICLISAKTGKNIDLLLEKIITDFPPPTKDKNEYIEKTGLFPNFKRQFRNITIPKEKKYSVNSVGINANNCPDEKLKHFLLEIEDILEKQ
ncbi:2271_t:CDS:2, partial [Funneliformis geosporum]